MLVRVAFSLSLAACSGTAGSTARPPTPQPPRPSPSNMLVSNPTDTVADAIPTGVASTDGRVYFVSSARGIDAVDAATGATAWSTGEANVPVLAFADTLLAIRGGDPIDGAWTGDAALVAIDVAAPHAARAGPDFTLPLERHGLVDVRAAGGALEAGWVARGRATGMLAAPPPQAGTITFDLAAGRATVSSEAHAPEVVRRDVAGATAWLAPWRTLDGWSALLALPGAAGVTVALRHWPDGGAATSTVVVATADLMSTGTLGANARHFFLRVCQPASAPTACEVRVHDAATGTVVAGLADAVAPAERLEPPLALIDRRLLAVRGHLPTGERALVAIELDRAAAGVVWRRPITGTPTLDVMP